MFTKIVENFITDDECEMIINYGISQNLDYIQTYSPTSGENFIDFKFNKRKGFMFDNTNLDNIAERSLNLINELKIYSNIKYNKVDSFLFNQYAESNFLNYHIDTAEIENGATITIVYQLNDDYEGGEFCYMIDDKEYFVPKKKGSIFIFESNILHRVMPVKNGVRYSLNNWPKYEKTKKLSLL